MVRRIRLCFSVLFCGLVAGACGGETPRQELPDRPTRIVSLDYCADQYVLKLVDRDRILAVSPDAEKIFSYMRASAKGLPKVRSQAEDVLVLKPDLVVRSYGGGPNAKRFFEGAGVPVLQVGYAPNLEGVKSVLKAVAEGLGERARGEAVVRDMDARLERIRTGTEPPAALYMTPAGVTTGPGTLVHEMLLAAGLANFQTEPGWRSLPLERLAYQQPDLIAAAFFEALTNHRNHWSAARHPVARRQLIDRPAVPLQGAWTACGGWFLLDAIEALARARQQLGSVQ